MERMFLAKEMCSCFEDDASFPVLAARSSPVG